MQRPALALSEEVRLIERDDYADAEPLSNRRAEIDVPGALLFHVEDDVDVALIIRRLGIRWRHRRLEEPEIPNALPAANQAILVVDVARNDRQLIANTRLDR